MQQVKNAMFYGFETDFFSVAIRLIEKLYSSNERVLVICETEDEVSFLNSKLWTYSQLSFIPHGCKHSLTLEEAKFCHTWISTELTFINTPISLINNGLNIKDNNISRFNKVIDIFNKELIDAVKSRVQYYISAGFINIKFWIQSNGTWEAVDLP
jgi:DNA polymerase IIIc chi subunit